MKYLILFLCCAYYVLPGQDYNIELLSNVRFNDESANIWGYASDGKEYAIIGRENGTSIFDVTDGKNPSLIKHIPGARGQWREIKSWKNYIYVVADQGQDGLLIINMALAPSQISFSFYRPLVMINDKVIGITKTELLNRAHELFIDEKGFCYLTGSNLHFGVTIFDLNKNPVSPEFVGIFNNNYSHDGFARNDTFWSADILAGKFTVWNLKDKKNPTQIASQQTGFAFTHNIWLSDDGRYAFTTDERANAFVESYDVSDLNNITLLDKYRSRTTRVRGTIPHNTHYFNSFLITSYYTDGLTIVDASNPAHLVEVGAYDTYPAGDGDFHGCWGVYPYLPSGNILASDIEFGLFVLKPNYNKAAYLKGVVKDSISGQVLENVKIKIGLIPFNETLSASDGTYKSGAPFTGEVSLDIIKEGFRAKQINVNLQQGQVTEADIFLSPLANGEITVRVVDAVTKLGIPNVQIQFERPESKFIVNTSSGGNSLNLIYEGEWNVHVAAWGYEFETKSITVNNLSQTLVIELSRRYEDNFSFNLGWTAASSAFRGIWGRVEPRGSYILEKAINPEFDIPFDYGDRCMVTGNGSTDAIGDDVDAGFTRLVSPAMDLSGYTQPMMSFYAWTVRTNLFDTIPAFGSHRVYLASGNDTLLLETLTPNNPAWKKYTILPDPSKIKNKSVVHIIFEALEQTTIDFRNIVEFAVDGFLLMDGPVTANKEEPNTLKKYKIFPSPFIDQITIGSDPEPFDRQIDFIDLNGRKVSSYNWKRLQSEIQLRPDVPPGIYFLQVSSTNSVETTVKVLKF